MASQTERTFTAADKLRCVERELKLRYNVYPRQVDAGKMKQQTANREIAVMEEIAADLRKLVEQEQSTRM